MLAGGQPPCTKKASVCWTDNTETITATAQQEILIKFQETGGTVTHSLQVLHSLASFRTLSEHCAQALTQA